MHTRQLSELKATNPYLRMGTDVSDLEKSIKTVGLIAPLVISPDNVILAGARRYQALLNLGYTEATVTIIDRGPLEQELVSIDENLVRKDLTKMEIESHLRRAKEIYLELNPPTEKDAPELAAGFVEMVAEKTGLSSKQIHQAIARDEKTSPVVKEARKKGELSVSQTNEIAKLTKDQQLHAIEHVKEMAPRELKKFVKLAQTDGVQQAIQQTPNDPFAREFIEINAGLRKLLKRFKALDEEGVEFNDLPEETRGLLGELQIIANSGTYDSTYQPGALHD